MRGEKLITRHIVCYSGGHASALVAVEVVRRYGAAEVVLLNHDLNADKEDADIKRFKRDVAAYVGLPITYANIHGLPEGTTIPDQFAVCIAAKAFKIGTGTELCTNRLKTKPFLQWLETHVPDKKCCCYYGFETHEPARMERRRRILGALGYATAFPLHEWPRTLDAIEEVGIARPRTYAIWKHANCKGCLKAGKQHWYCVFCLHPDIWAQGKEAEATIGYSIHNGEPLTGWETEFAAMQAAGVVPTEITPPGRFWAEAKRRVKLARQGVQWLELQEAA